MLSDLLLIFAIGVGVALVLHRVRVPSIAGFIVAGILIGPRSLSLITDLHDIEIMAEVGVILLLFGVGLELSLEKVRRLWKPIVLGGALQVGITIGVAAWISTGFALNLKQGIFLGFMVAVSSTVIVLRGLEYRGEINAPHGRFALGILIFQDLCVVPMMLAIPILAESQGDIADSLIALAKAAAVVVGVLIASRIAVPRLLHHVALTRQRDLFVLVVLLICIGTAWVVSLVGVSLALGAFLAGLVVAGSDYRHQAVAELIPFREVLASLFFITIGMLFDPAVLIPDPRPVFTLLGVILIGKFAVVMAVGLILGLPLKVSLITGMSLAQAGEFLFVLLRAAQGKNLVGDPLASQLVAAAILSMLITPLLMYLSPHVAAGVSRVNILQRLLGVRTARALNDSAQMTDHVIIAGHGIAGEALVDALRAQGIPYSIVDLNAETIRLLSMQGEPAYFGDVTSAEVLERLGIHRARELVVTISDSEAAVRATSTARKLAPDLPLLARVRYVGEVEPMLEVGATTVVASEYESAVEIVSLVLARHGIENREINTHIERMHANCRAKES
ncbi:MAG: cation:proton antiporter [Myxococcota bacterium]|nr:cation:proton antiporter [Myxococcota bacterium]